jgi:hypothetical protein
MTDLNDCYWPETTAASVIAAAEQAALDALFLDERFDFAEPLYHQTRE